ncbi:hypothetical protein [Marinicrinis lubricantis]|uniref:YgiT-type zinc finger domain-containing protein n=1 Tax=Marinicrinis lubricantis TaxID=2086470 RepID=A0ABW1IQ97_9BACL
MGFCCGASMIGTRGSLKHLRTQIHNVPLLYCPVCHRVEVHHEVETEYEILTEYAQADGAVEVDFEDYAPVDHLKDNLFENCVNTEDEPPLTVVNNQIDLALDLLAFAKQISDLKWQEQLHKRLRVLGQKKAKLSQNKQQLN